MSRRRWYGSFQNRIEEQSRQPKPEIGMGATELMHSDRHPYTIVEISPSGKTIGLQRDDWKVIEGSEFDGSAKYQYTPNPEMPVEKARQNKNGQWKLIGGSYVALGIRERYYDPTL